jgi:hypothetical protein
MAHPWAFDGGVNPVAVIWQKWVFADQKTLDEYKN